MDYSTILETMNTLIMKREAYAKHHCLTHLIDEKNMLIVKWGFVQSHPVTLGKVWLTASDEALPEG